MRKYYINRKDLADQKQFEQNRLYIAGKTTIPQPAETMQGALRKSKFLWNLHVISTYLLENIGFSVSISELEKEIGDLLVLSYNSNQWRKVKKSSTLEEIRQCIRLIYVDAYAQTPDFKQVPVVVSHDHHNYTDNNGFPLERPIREFAPESKDIDRHASGRLLTGKKDRNPPMTIIARNSRYLLEYTDKLNSGKYVFKTVEQRNAVCL